MGTLINEARSGSGSIRSASGSPVLDETYSYLVKADSLSETRLSVLQTSGLPLVNVSVSPSGIGTCRSKNADRREDNPLYWDVSCEFSSDVQEGQNNQDPSSDPEQWRPIYETKFERIQEHVTKDQNGDAIVNSANQAFPEGIIRNRFIPIWEFFQFESSTVTDETIIERNEVVNSGTFKGRDAKTLLCTVVSSVIGFYYGRPRRLTQYQLKYNEQTWEHKRLDIGNVYKSGGSYLPYLDDEDNQIYGPLNGSGGKAAVGTDPSVLTFDLYPTNSFSFLRV